MSSEYNNLEFEGAKQDSVLWVMSLSALFSIVLSIFVLLFAISSTSKIRTAQGMEGVKGKFSQENTLPTQKVIDEPEFAPTKNAGSGAEEVLKLYYAEMRKVAKDVLALEEARMIEKGNVLILQVPAYLLFDPTTANLDDKKMFLEALADQLTTTAVSQNIDIDFMAGYTLTSNNDGKQLNLAINRAGTFARKMVDLGVKESGIYAGIGEVDPEIITITFSPRDETRASLVF